MTFCKSGTQDAIVASLLQLAPIVLFILRGAVGGKAIDVDEMTPLRCAADGQQLATIQWQ
jgi:hypothetical protein